MTHDDNCKCGACFDPFGRIEDLEAALSELVRTASAVELGRSIHNSRRAGDHIEGPVWVDMGNAIHAARAVLRKDKEAAE